MPKLCSVVGCGSNSARDIISFHKFPTIFNKIGRIDVLAQERRKKWIKSLRRTDITEEKIKYRYICSRHFYGGKPSKLSETESIDWVPNQYMGYKSTNATLKENLEQVQILKDGNKVDIKQKKETPSTENYNENAEPTLQPSEKEVQKDKNEDAEPTLQPSEKEVQKDENEDAEPTLQPSEKEVQKDINEDAEPTLQPTEEIQTQDKKKDEIIAKLSKDLIYANSKIYELRDSLKNYKFDLEWLKNDTEQCRFYTGLDFEYFYIVFKFISPFLSNKQSTILNKVEMVMLTLMKLRLNLLFKDLGYRFNISRQSASRVFFSVLNIFYIKLKFLIHWPERDCLQMNVPACFLEHFGKKVTIIIDCFEIFTETPTNKNAAAQHFSNYKHHNTIKFLIGIAPQGSIMFISEAFTGRCSDKFIVENSNFLDKLNPGDLILADRGFLIHDQVRQYLAEVQMPAFLRGAKQMMPKDVEATRTLANVRIHVERLISQLKQKYNILGNIVPVTILKKKDKKLPVINKIVVVCCALVNICPAVI